MIEQQVNVMFCSDRGVGRRRLLHAACNECECAHRDDSLFHRALLMKSSGVFLQQFGRSGHRQSHFARV
jgi:hypothetical protein